MNIGERASYFYIKHIKKWMECPVCHDKMVFNNATKSWFCQKCPYTLTESDFLDDFVFWFCDKCGAYLNIQSGFNRKAIKHICQRCGFENDTSPNNIK